MTDGGDGDGNGAEPASKRRRVALACNACRTRKSRCNGERPKCSLCKNLGFDCQYEPAESSTNVIVRKEYVSDFETRLKGVEKMLRRHDDLLWGHLNTCGGPASPMQEDGAVPGEFGRSSQRTTMREGGLGNGTLSSHKIKDGIMLSPEEVQDLPAEETVTDGMAMSFADEHDTVYFGPSSNIAFTRHILRAMASQSMLKPRTLAVRGAHAQVESGILNYSQPPSPTKADVPDRSVSPFELPPRAELEHLMSAYFGNTGMLFPFVHEPTFMKTYRQFKESNFTKVRRAWLGLLNIILAMAISFNPGTKESAPGRYERSDVFYKRSLELGGRLSTRGASLDTVQYLLLASQYLQGTHKSSQTWTLHGLAVKGAFSLGLHSHQPSQRFTPLENEIRKRTWYGCVLLDRVLSMTFGRPLGIAEEYIRLPLARSMSEVVDAEVMKDNAQHLSAEFFNASVTHHRLIAVAIGSLYGYNTGWDDDLDEAELIPRIYNLERDLRVWQKNLSPDMKLVYSTAVLPSPSTHHRNIFRFRTMLTLRFHNLNILVHRPFLCKALDHLAAKSSATPLSRRCKDAIDVCLESAEETINVVHTVLTDPSLGAYVLGAWWFTLFYTFNSALVVFANSLVKRSMRLESDLQQYPQDIECLSRAVDALGLLDDDNRVVTRCSEYVQYLRKVLELWSRQSGMQTPVAGSSEAAPPLQQQQQQQVTNPAVPQTYQPLHMSMTPQQMNLGGQMEMIGEMPDLNDFLKDDLELAQFFASGIFDMQNSADGMM